MTIPRCVTGNAKAVFALGDGATLTNRVFFGLKNEVDKACHGSLTADDYTQATCSPVDAKFKTDVSTLGISFWSRHARRKILAGQACGGAMSLVGVFVSALLVAGSGGALLILAGISQMWTEPRERTLEGVREDKILRAIDTVQYNIEQAISIKGQYRLQTGEAEKDSLRDLVVESDAAYTQASGACRRWPNGRHSPSYKNKLKALKGNIDQLKQMIARAHGKK